MNPQSLNGLTECVAKSDPSRGSRLKVRLARTWDEVEAAQRLRWRVFADELGANLAGSAGRDQDRFDDHCEHLLAIDQLSGRVVGTYRLLTPAGAQRSGGLYCESEFDLTPLKHLRASMMEAGRACIDPVWRGSAVLSMMWGALYRVALQHRVDTIVGCASVGLADDPCYAADLAVSLEASWVESDSRVTPHTPFDYRELASGASIDPPTLIKGYLRAGAKVGGIPAFDRDFQCADFLMILPLQRMTARFVRRFEGTTEPQVERLAA